MLSAQFSLSGSSEPPPLHGELFLEQSESGGVLIKVKTDFPEGFHQVLDRDNFFLEIVSPEGLVSSLTQYPPARKDARGMDSFTGSCVLALELPSQLLDEKEDDSRGIVRLHYQLCDEDGQCFFPETLELDFDFAVLQTMSSKRAQSSFAGLWFYLLMALIGGFLLNFMPCVLPLLSVKAMNLMNQSKEDRKTLMAHGFLYTLGILVSFWVLSSVIVVLQQSGKMLGWGFHFQSPLFLALLISIIYLFALSLFEVFLLLPPTKGMSKADSLSRKKGFAGSFFTGVFAVFVATPCTAPFLGSAMGFAFTSPGTVIFLIMTATGLGLSLPFLLLGFFPGFFKILPKPGMWMEKFREAMGFLLMATVVYLSGTLLKQIGSGFSSLLWYLLVLSVAAWLWGWNSRKSRTALKRRLIQFLILSLILGSGVFLLDFAPVEAPSNQVSGVQTYDEIPFNPDRIQEIREAEEPLLLIFSASWCTSCKINEKTVFHRAEVRDLFHSKGLVVMKADLTVDNPPAMKWLYRFGRAGVPLYVLYLPGKEPRILPESLSLSLLKEELSSLP